MKKLLLIVAIIALFVGIVVATKPQSEKVLAKTKAPVSQEIEAVNQTAEIQTLPEMSKAQCDQQADAYELKQELEKRLAEDLLALKEKPLGLDNERLMEFAEAGLGNKQMSHHFKTEEKAEPPRKDRLRDLLKGDESSKKVMEDIFMLSMAGKHTEVMEKFDSGQLAPFSPENYEHKQALVTVLLQTSGTKGLSIYNLYYGEEQAIPEGLAATILATETSTDNIKSIIERIDASDNSETWGFFGRRGDPLSATLEQGNFKAAEQLLDSNSYQPNLEEVTLNTRNIEEIPEAIISKLLDRGYKVERAGQASSMAAKLKESSPTLAIRFSQISQQIQEQDKQLFESAPQALQQLIAKYQADKKQMLDELNACNILKAKTEPTVPEYQPINIKEIEANIKAMQAAGSSNQDIIISLSAKNMETVEYVYEYFTKKKSLILKDMNQIPQEVRDLIGLMHQQDWQGIIDSLKKNRFDPEWGISPYGMASELKKKGAPEHFIAELVKLGEGSPLSSKDLQRLRYDQEGLDTLLSYGVNLNKADEKNKTLLYYAATGGSPFEFDKLKASGLHFQPDPYGFDSLDVLLRRNTGDDPLIEKLADSAFPIKEEHLNYAKYLKQYYPESYQQLIEIMPVLTVEGLWRENSDQNVN